MNEGFYQSNEPSLFMSLYYMSDCTVKFVFAVVQFLIHFLFVLPILIIEQNHKKLKIFVSVLVPYLFLEFH